MELLLFACFGYVGVVSSDHMRRFGEHEYFVSSDKAIWDDAKNRCADKGGLAIISTELENTSTVAIAQEFNENYIIGLRNSGATDCACLGSSNTECTECRSRWRWYDGTPVIFENWIIFEPHTNEGYGRITPGGWAGHLSYQPHRYLCQKHLCTDLDCINGVCIAANGSAHCECDVGFTGHACETDICEELQCINGMCIGTSDPAFCECNAGYTGQRCETDICEELQCIDGMCMGTNDPAFCECNAGYAGQRCETDIDECASQPCLNDGICEDKVNSFQCYCDSSFYGPVCQTVVDAKTGEKGKDTLSQASVIGMVAVMVVLVVLLGIALAVIVILKRRAIQPNAEENNYAMTTTNTTTPADQDDKNVYQDIRTHDYENVTP